MAAEKARLYWADYLRAFVVMLVVNVHACATYSHVGGWYLQIGKDPPFLVKSLLAAWQAHIHSFFMGLLFFLAGYFAHLSLVRKGTAPFVKERFLRLALPAFVYMALFHTIIVMLTAGDKAPHSPVGFYLYYVQKTSYLLDTGHLWFALFLLMISVAFAWYRQARPLAQGVDTPLETVQAKPVLLVGLSLVCASFLVRIWFPVRYGFHDFQPCYFSQYIIAFAAGIYTARHKGLAVLAASPLARRAGICALCCSPLFLGLLYVLGGKVETVYFGGLRWQAFGFAAWEQFTGLGLSLGLLSIFSQKLNVDSPKMRWMAERSFGVYVFHGPVIVVLAVLLKPVHTSPFILVGVVTVLGIVLSHIVAAVVSKIPGLAKLF
ncbi:MAG: acyltransferase family protein [Armatimonadetes bacterium]|nr:acyltransferase family protein [Armatimonadota bacterium]